MSITTARSSQAKNTSKQRTTGKKPRYRNSSQLIDYTGNDHDGYGPFRHVAAGRTHGDRRFAEALAAKMDANDGLKKGRLAPLTSVTLDALAKLIAYRRAAGDLDKVPPAQYVRVAVAHLVARAEHRLNDPGRHVRQWIDEHIPEFQGTPNLKTPFLQKDTIADALAIRQDEIDANVINRAFVSIDRPPEVRAADDLAYDRQYSEDRRRAQGAKPQSERTRTRDIQRIAEAHGVKQRTMYDRIKKGLVDFDAEMAKLAASPSGPDGPIPVEVTLSEVCKKASVTKNTIISLSPTDFCNLDGAPPPWPLWVRMEALALAA